jgi:hypothetical protein
LGEGSRVRTADSGKAFESFRLFDARCRFAQDWSSCLGLWWKPGTDVDVNQSSAFVGYTFHPDAVCLEVSSDGDSKSSSLTRVEHDVR